MSTFCEIQNETKQRQPLKMCRVTLKKLSLIAENLPRAKSVSASNTITPAQQLKPPLESSNPDPDGEMKASNGHLDSCSESAEDDWLFQLTGSYTSLGNDNNIQELHTRTSIDFATEIRDDLRERGLVLLGKVQEPRTTPVKTTVKKPADCPREERIRKLKKLLSEQEEAVTKMQIHPVERTAEITESSTREETRLASPLTDRLVHKNAVLGNVQGNGVFDFKIDKNGSQTKALVRRNKNYGAAVQPNVSAQLSLENRRKKGLKTGKTKKEGTNSTKFRKVVGEVALTSIKGECRKSGVIFSIENLQGKRGQTKVGVKNGSKSKVKRVNIKDETSSTSGMKREVRKGGSKNMSKAKSTSTANDLKNVSTSRRNSVGNCGKHRGKKRHDSPKNRNDCPLLSNSNCKRKKGSGSEMPSPAMAANNSWREKVEQLMKKEWRTCEEFMTILGLKCVNKPLQP